MKQHRRQNTFIDGFSNMENYYINSLLKGELNQVYKGVQSNCADFRKNVFAKNLAILDSKLTRTRHHHAMSYDLRQYETAHEKLLKTIKTPEQLLEEYTTKANQEQIDE